MCPANRIGAADVLLGCTTTGHVELRVSYAVRPASDHERRHAPRAASLKYEDPALLPGLEDLWQITSRAQGQE